jgi:hypothetical protein
MGLAEAVSAKAAPSTAGVGFGVAPDERFPCTMGADRAAGGDVDRWSLLNF